MRARRALRRLKGLKRLEVLGQGDSIQKQTSTTLSYLQSWSKIQAEIRARRICMVTEGRIKQRKQENQLKLEAKLHDIEVIFFFSLSLNYLCCLLSTVTLSVLFHIHTSHVPFNILLPYF